MRAVVQRVTQASITVDNETVGRIDQGLLVYLGVQQGDTDTDVQYIADKLTHLRIFSDAEGKMNLSVQDIKGSILLVSQFTLCGDCRKGRRPGFDLAAEPALAEQLYQDVQNRIAAHGLSVETGIFRAKMDVSSVNDGPVTFLLDSRRGF